MTGSELNPETLVVSAGRPPIADDAGVNVSISLNAPLVMQVVLLVTDAMAMKIGALSKLLFLHLKVERL